MACGRTGALGQDQQANILDHGDRDEIESSRLRALQLLVNLQSMG